MTDPAEHPPLSERERIQALLDAERISPQDAELLFSTLDDEKSEEAVYEADEDASTNEATAETTDWLRQGEQDAVPLPPLPPEPLHPTIPQPPLPPYTDASALHWIKIDMLAGNLELHVDPNISTPVVSGHAEVRQQGQDFSIQQGRKKHAQGWLEGVLGGLEPLDVRIPKGYGVDLDMKAGNAELRGVPALRGRVLAGNLSAWELGGLSLSMKAGNFEASVRLTKGQHHLNLKAGGATLRFLSGSQVQVTGEVKAGTFRSRSEAFKMQRSVVGGSFEGLLGSAQAHLEIQQKAGTLELKVEDDPTHD